MALQLATTFAGAGLGILGAIGQNKSVRKARDRAIAQEQVRTSIEIGNNARRTSQITGARQVSLGRRNVFGRSSQAAVLSDISTGLRNEEALLMQEFFNIADIKSQASRQKANPLGAAISGGLSGFQFGSSLEGLMQARAQDQFGGLFDSGAIGQSFMRGISFPF